MRKASLAHTHMMMMMMMVNLSLFGAYDECLGLGLFSILRAMPPLLPSLHLCLMSFQKQQQGKHGPAKTAERSFECLLPMIVGCAACRELLGSHSGQSRIHRRNNSDFWSCRQRLRRLLTARKVSQLGQYCNQKVIAVFTRQLSCHGNSSSQFG